MKKNDLNSSYWENRYKENDTGWDIGHISLPLKVYFDQLQDKSVKILVPGSGNSHEIEYLWKLGFKHIYAADIAKTPLTNLKTRLKDFPENQLLHTDFFKISDTFDVIIEQTFFCALHPSFRKAYVEQMTKLLKSKGKLVGLLFNFPLSETGPPFGGNKAEYSNLFRKDFNIKVLEPSINSIKQRLGNELFFIFEKKT
ncbi:methyltransferase domain-containing protein [Winogradskyella aurantia]|nr:methyltransferase domain-containing protein [Winogradskyella aurantia]